MNKYERLSFEEHQELGEGIKAFYQAVSEAGMRYPKSSRVATNSRSVNKALGRLRSVLEDEMYSEHREQASTKIYYGPCAYLGV